MKTGSFTLMKKCFILLLVVVCVSLAATSVFAAQTTSTMKVSATKGGSFTMSVSSDLDFGTVASGTYSELTSGAFSVTGTTGMNYQIGIDAGLYVSGSRRVNSAGNMMYYILFGDAAHTVYWGTSGLVTPPASPYGDPTRSGLTATGAAQSFNVYGRLTALMTDPDGVYTDTVTIIAEW